MLEVSIVTLAFVKLEEALHASFHDERLEGLPLIHHVRDLELATTIEAEDGELQPAVYRRFKSMSHKDAKFIVQVRNSLPFSSFSLEEERLVYKCFRKLFPSL